MKVSELSGKALALWVAKALGYKLTKDLVQIGEAAAGMRNPVICYSEAGVLGVAGGGLRGPWRPHEDWAQGGPIIDLGLINLEDNDISGDAMWGAKIVSKTAAVYYAMGPTALIAAMRAFVASKYGDEVPDDPT